MAGPGVQGRVAELPVPGVCQPSQRGGCGHQPVHRLPPHRLLVAVCLWAGTQEGFVPSQGKFFKIVAFLSSAIFCAVLGL